MPFASTEFRRYLVPAPILLLVLAKLLFDPTPFSDVNLTAAEPSQYLTGQIVKIGDQYCIRWTGKPDHDYLVEASNEQDTWTELTRIDSSQESMQYCLEKPYRYVRVGEIEPPASAAPTPQLISTSEESPSSLKNNDRRPVDIQTASKAVESIPDLSNAYQLDDVHRLMAGDRVSFRIIEDRDDPVQLIVTDSGDLEIPYIGRTPVQGKTCREVAKAIKPILETKYYYLATIILAVDQVSQTRGVVYVIGAVNQPGQVQIPGNEEFTISKAILAAGGFGGFANKKKVRVTRLDFKTGTTQQYEIDIDKIWDEGIMDSDLKLEPGDQIFVRERAFNF